MSKTIWPVKACEVCGSSFRVTCMAQIEKKRFCSLKCSRKAFLTFPDLIKKRQDALLRPEVLLAMSHKGNKNPWWGGGPVRCICLWCKAPFKTAKHRVHDGNGKYCSKACFVEYQGSGILRRPLVHINCKLCGKGLDEIPSIAKRKKFCSRRCTSLYTLKTRDPKRETRIERILEQQLKDLNFSYEKQKPLLRSTVADFFVAPNFVIYADGDYWHSRPEVIDRDIRINTKLKEAGFKILRFSENSLVTDLPSVQNTLKENLYAQC